MERDKYFPSLLHSACEGFNYFFSSEAQKKILPNNMSKNMRCFSLYNKQSGYPD